jgi:hypothetical protein
LVALALPLLALALPLLALSLLLTPAQAAPIERDLGKGLVFWRAHALPADLPPDAAIGRHPCVLDVRYAAGDRGAATALAGWLKFHASARTPVFLLANPATSAALLAPFASATSVAGLVIIGPRAPNFEPDIAVAVSPAAERRAYDALERGTSIESLVVEKVPKIRDDEEALERERDGEASESAPAAAMPQPPPPPPLVDPVLQRAVQLHRGLLALGRI